MIRLTNFKFAGGDAGNGAQPIERDPGCPAPLELALRQVTQKQEMDPCVCAGDERRVDEYNPRSLVGGRAPLIETLGKGPDGE